MNKKITAALNELYNEQFAAIEASALSAGEFETTPEYNENMQKLIKRVDRPVFMTVAKHAARVACLLVAVISVSLFAINADSTPEKTVFDFQYSPAVTPGGVIIHLAPEDYKQMPKLILDKYSLGYIPEDYRVEYEGYFEYGYSSSYYIDYRNSEGDYLKFTQSTGASFNPTVDSEYSISQECVSNGNIYMVRHRTDSTTISVFWNNGEYVFSVSTVNMPKDDVIDLCNSLKLE